MLVGVTDFLIGPHITQIDPRRNPAVNAYRKPEPGRLERVYQRGRDGRGRVGPHVG